MKKFDIKERIGAFLLKEDGKMSKKTALRAGIILGTFAFAAESASAKCKYLVNKYDGDCPDENAKLLTTPPKTCDAENGAYAHTNAAHANNLNLKNLFGKLVLGHGNCIETHQNHYNYVHGDGGGGSCGTCNW